MLTLIWAQSKNGVIGSNGKIPWSLPEDMQHFKKSTIGKTVIMGRQTWDSLYIRPLTNRKNVVITHNPKLIQKKIYGNKVDVFYSVKDALHFNPNSVIIGGKSIYDQTINYADKLIVTTIDKVVSGNVLSPIIDKNKWKIKSTSGQLHSKNGTNYSITVYSNSKS
jgi:dihydrofolate reductase